MDWLNLLQGASFVGLLIVSTYSGIQQSRVKGFKDRIADLQGDRDDLATRIEARDLAHAEEKHGWAGERSAYMQRLKDAEEEVAALRRTVTGEAHLTIIEGLIMDLTRALASHHDSTMGQSSQIKALLTKLETAMEQLRA